MNVLKKFKENYDRFIFKRSHEPNTLNYFHMKEQLEDSKTKDDKMMVDAYDETGNNEIAYNALLQSEILDIGDAVNANNPEFGNENTPTSLSCLQNFSKSRKITKKPNYLEVNSDTLFTQ